MKKLILSMVAMLALSAQAKTVKTTIPVAGKCAMCEKRIEKTAKAVPGVLSASWDKATQKLTLVYDNKKTDVKRVARALAAVGHDAAGIKAPASAYDKLPACCKGRKACNK